MAISEILTLEETAEYLKLGRQTVYHLARTGKIPVKKILRQWRFDQKELEKWVRDRREVKTDPRIEEESQIKILVVDDKPEILETTSEGICTHMENVRVHTADNGIQALIAVGKFMPNVVIIDIEMPEMDGIEVCRKLKEDSGTSDIFIIAVTGYTNKGYKELALAAGADEFIEKPFKLEKIVDVIKQRIEQCKSLRSA